VATRGPRGRAERPRGPRRLEQIPVWSDGAADAGLFPAQPGTRRPGRRGGPASATPPTGVDALLDGLSRDQRRAVTHGEGPLLVVAGAGTGKTQVITRRIAWLIATRRAKPSEILALTFTDKAAEEMQARVDRLVPYGFTDATISTFHAFGDRVLRESALELGLPTDVRVLSRPETVLFLRERLFAFDLDAYRPLGDPTRFLDALAAHFSRCKDEDVSPADYAAFVGRLVEAAAAADARATAPRATAADREAAAVAADLARRQGELAAAYARYQDLMAEAGHVDFGDQVSLALRLLRQSPSARDRLRRRIRYILVDEFQDTNRAQWELVALLADPARNLTVVGDDDQSIYRFRGAAISNILGFLDRFPGATKVVLRRNYRSRAPILDAAYRLIRFNDPDRLEVRAGVVKRLVADRRGGRAIPVRSRAFATGSEEADEVARDIARRIAAGAAPREHAILVRSNAGADPYLRALNVAGVPWRFSGASGLYSRPEVRLLLAFLRAIADPSSTVDVYALAASEVYGLGGTDLAGMVARARRTNRSLFETLEDLEAQPGLLRLADATRERAARLLGDLRRFGELAHERSAGEVLYAFLRETGTLARYAAAETLADEEALLNVARFFDIVRARSALLEDDRAVHLAPYLKTLVEAGDDPATADLDEDVDAVSVLTVHKAKGLEFPVVFLVGLVAGRFPSSGRRDPIELPPGLADEPDAPSGDVHLQEERRLFYVAMTRARDELVLTHAADYGGRRTRRISQFVLEALDLPRTEPPSPGAGTVGTAPSALERVERGGAAEPIAEPVRTSVGGPLSLSFRQVDDYLTCPLKYRYVHVLRLPTAPHHAVVYGAALHQAILEFHRSRSRGDAMTEEELVEAFDRTWSNEGFLTREHEEARRGAGHAALVRFREAQLAQGAVVPTYVEKDFSFSLGGDRVRGRWDRVDVEPVEPDMSATELADGGAPAAEAAPGDSTGGLDLETPTQPFGTNERVTITDYKSSDVRDPVVARQRARDSLQLSIYALAWQAVTGRPADAVQLHFLESGIVGRAEVDEKRLAKARDLIRKAAEGIRAASF